MIADGILVSLGVAASALGESEDSVIDVAAVVSPPLCKAAVNPHLVCNRPIHVHSNYEGAESHPPSDDTGFSLTAHSRHSERPKGSAKFGSRREWRGHIDTTLRKRSLNF